MAARRTETERKKGKKREQRREEIREMRWDDGGRRGARRWCLPVVTDGDDVALSLAAAKGRGRWRGEGERDEGEALGSEMRRGAR